MTALDTARLAGPGPADAATRSTVDVDGLEAPAMWDPDRLHIIHLNVYLDNGRAYVAHVDQRDQRRAFVALGTQDPEADKLGFLRACAWAHLTRTGQLEAGWRAFDDTCIEVSDTEEPSAVDPTGPASAG